MQCNAWQHLCLVIKHSTTLTWPHVVLGCPVLAAYGLLLRVVVASSCRSNQNATALHTPPALIVNVSCCSVDWKETSASGVLKSKEKTTWGAARGLQVLTGWCAASFPAVCAALVLLLVVLLLLLLLLL
jgi:hypothetical protein